MKLEMEGNSEEEEGNGEKIMESQVSRCVTI